MAEPVRKTVGIIGGMGPAATAEFFARLVRATSADVDQEHVHVVIDSDPTIPDRTLAIVGGGPSPLPKLIAVARRLEAFGAELLVMPCNTAHAFAPEVAAAVSIPLVSWVSEAADAITPLEPRPERVGLLATTGTVASGVYQDALAARGIETVVPTEPEQADVMAAVYGLKAGDADQPRVREVLESLVERGAEAVLLACTELPELALDGVAVPVIDPAALVAARVVDLAGGSARQAVPAA
jgi:aspartate racemase